MHKILSLLVKLQKLDLNLDKIRSDKESFLLQVNSYEKKIKQLEKELKEKKKETKEIKKKRREREERIEEIDILLSKHEEEKYKVKSQDEFDALDKEVTQLEKEKKEVEDVILDLMEREEIIARELPLYEKEKEEEKKRLKKNKNNSLEVIDKLIQKEEILKREREELICGLDNNILNQYEKLRKIRGGLAVARIEKGVCEACRVKVSTSLAYEVSQGKGIIYCENCSRILYIPDN